MAQAQPPPFFLMASLTAEDEDKEDSDALHSRGNQEVHGAWVSPSSASSDPVWGESKRPYGYKPQSW